MYQLYQYECPWPSAQAEIVSISAYKTPGDKLQCVVRASQTIMNLLSLAHDQSVPAADDFMPVLVYVLIKVWLSLAPHHDGECNGLQQKAVYCMRKLFHFIVVLLVFKGLLQV